MDIIEQINNEKIQTILETSVYDLNLLYRTQNSLKKAGFNTIIDIIKFDDLKRIRRFGEKSIIDLKQKLLEFGIDYDDKKQCEELIKIYNSQAITQKDNEISEYKKELDLEESNYILERRLRSKQETLEGIKEQIRRREYLKQQLIECDKEYNRLIRKYTSLNSNESNNSYEAYNELIEKYSSLNSKESSNDHGTK